MTTKYKIIIGFVCMIVLLAAVSVLGYYAMDNSLNGLNEYRRYAHINVRLSDSLGALNQARSALNRFLAHHEEDSMAEADSSMENFDKVLADALLEVHEQADREAMAKLRAEGRKYKGESDSTVAAVTAMGTYYQSTVRANMQNVKNLLHTLAGNARDNNVMPVAYAVETVWNDYAMLLGSLGRYSYGREADDMAAAHENAASMRKNLEILGTHIVAPAGRITYGKLMPAATAILDSVAEMEKEGKAANAALDATRGTRADINKSLAALHEIFDAKRLNVGTTLAQQIETEQFLLLGFSIGGIALGILFAAFILFGLIRVLRETSNFADAVAKGNFNYAITVREKGEIGSLIQDLRQIPAVLGRLLEEASVLSDSIQAGQFRERLNDHEFSGSFNDLSKAFNTVSDSYTRVLDRLGIPVVCCDPNSVLIFLNKAAQSTLGGNPVGRTCREEMNSPLCGTAECFGVRAMRQDSEVDGETTIHPRGLSVEVAVDAVPLHNRKHEVVGFMEAITDLTEVKSKQAIMLRIAQDAEEIATRVAAASEELSAQVEQISHGAEMQRDRMSSTADAMSEMNATVLEVARNAGEASEQSEETRMKAQQGSELVNQVVEAINAVNAVGQNLQGNMQELGKQAESIGNVMNVISDIADQTNLLALNAAIEAARAGEAGRGFAVVADEVRKLAEKTMQATQEVGSSIRAVQQSARVNIDEVGKAVASVAEANSLANSSGASLKEIVTLAAANSSVVASIATAAEEQSATSEEINSSIVEINKIVAETSDGMVQSASAVQDLSRMAQELHRVMDGIR